MATVQPPAPKTARPAGHANGHAQPAGQASMQNIWPADASDRPIIWVNGKLVPKSQATVSVYDHGLLYGDGVFEGIRVYRGPAGLAVFRLREHVQRLFDSAKLYKIPMPVSFQQVFDACREVVRANGLDECYLRPLAYLGHGPLGVYAKNVPTDVIVAAFPWGRYLGPESLERGIKATVSSWRRPIFWRVFLRRRRTTSARRCPATSAAARAIRRSSRP